MDKQNLISSYNFIHYSFQNIHSAGPDIFFSNPCIGYIKKGCAKFLYNGKTIYAKEEDLIYIASGTRYQSIWYGYPDIEWYSIEFEFSSKHSFYEYRFQILKNYPSELFEKMFETYSDTPMIFVSYFYLLLDDIYKKMKTFPVTKAFSSIEPAIHYIEKNYDKPIPIKTLEEVCHLSKSSIFNKFKSLYGVTPISYKHNIMIQHAIDLLSNTSLSIEEISRCVGFPSSNYFRKIFVELTGKKPKDLRNNP